MRRLAALLSLLAALTGTPLRQAEAASDYVRALSHFFQPANLQTPDGGVGDDSGVVTLTAINAGSAGDSSSAACLFLPPPDFGMPAITPAEAEGLDERVWWPPAPPNIRHAWLQVFLF